jgi:hypothetical protein
MKTFFVAGARFFERLVVTPFRRVTWILILLFRVVRWSMGPVKLTGTGLMSE